MDQNLELYIYDKSFNRIAMLDAYSSLIWADRYSECGDFELSLPYIYGQRFFGNYLKLDNFCGIEYSDRIMIIERIEYSHEEDSAPEMVVSGRSLESILSRRVVTGKVSFGTENSPVSIQDSIQSLLNSHVINPSAAERKIDGFIFSVSTDPVFASMNFSDSYDGDDLYNIISGICGDKKLGFRIRHTSDNNFEFSLFKGKDRSRSQNVNSYVIFSPGYDNLKNSNYFTSIEDYKNFGYVSTGEGTNIQAYEDPLPSGLTRRETWIEQDDLKNNKKTTLTNDQIKVKALKKMKKENGIKTGIEGEIIPGVIFEYCRDYYVGDRVELTDIYGNSQSVQISEVVISCDENGLQIIPTFEDIEEA